MINSEVNSFLKIFSKNKSIIKKVFKLKNNNLVNEIQKKITDNFTKENFIFINSNTLKELEINNNYYNLIEPLYFYNPKTNNIIIILLKEINNEYLVIFYLIFENNFTEDSLTIEALSNILELQEITNYELYFKDYQKTKLFTQYLNEYNLNIPKREIDLSKKVINPNFINILNSIFNQKPFELNETNLSFLQELEDINFLKILFVFKCSVKNEFIFQTNGVNNLKPVLNTFLCPHCKKPLKNELIEPKFEVSIFFERFINNNIWLKNIIIDYLLNNFTKDLKIYEYDKDVLLININSSLFFIFIVNLNNSNLINYFSFTKDMEVLNILSSFFIINPISTNKINPENFNKFNFPNLFIIYFENINYNNFLEKMNFIKEIINMNIFEKNIKEIIINFNIEKYVNYISLKEKDITKKEEILTEKQEILEEKEKQIEITIIKESDIQKESVNDNTLIIDIEKDINNILEEEINVKKSSQQDEIKVEISEIKTTETEITESSKTKEEKEFINLFEDAFEDIINQKTKEESQKLTPEFTNNTTSTQTTKPTETIETIEIIKTPESTETTKSIESIESIESNLIESDIKQENTIKLETESNIKSFIQEENQIKSKEFNTESEVVNKDLSIIESTFDTEPTLAEYTFTEETTQLIDINESSLLNQTPLQEELKETKVNKYELVSNYINSISFKEVDIFLELYSLNNLKTFNEIFSSFILLFSKEGKNNPVKVIQDTLEFSKSKNLSSNTFVILYSNKFNLFPKNDLLISKFDSIFTKLFNIRNNILSKKFELLLVYDKFSFYSLLNISSLILGTLFFKNVEFNWLNNLNIDNKEIFIKYKKEVIDFVDNYIKDHPEIDNHYIITKEWEIINQEQFKLSFKGKIIDELKLIYKLYNCFILKDNNLSLLLFKISDKYNVLLNFKNVILILELNKLDISLISNIISKLGILDLI
ncbi:MAG: hypothetical protein N2485_04345 [bacterium]|nr:hypothetical protein [bacterium]